MLDSAFGIGGVGVKGGINAYATVKLGADDAAQTKVVGVTAL